MSAGPTPLPQVEIDAAAALSRLGNALLSHRVPACISEEVVRQLTVLANDVEATPSRSKAEAFSHYSGHQRVEHFLATGSWPSPPPDGGEVVFDALSFVGGALNPFSAGARYYRDGDEAVCRVSFGSGYEGPPARVHGGMLAAAFDEVMGAVFRVLGHGSAFTGTLSVRYEAPAPINEPVELRARLAQTVGRKHTVEATAEGAAGRFASATATFIEMSPEHLAAAVAQS